eukprot:s2948_g3.t3
MLVQVGKRYVSEQRDIDPLFAKSMLDLLSRSKVFRDTHEEFIRDLIVACTRREYPVNRYLMEEGMKGDSMFVLFNGIVEVTAGGRFHQALPFLLFLGCHSDKADLSSSVCDASGNCKDERPDERLSRTLVLPPFWVPDTDGDQYQDEKAHFEPFENLYDPSAFESYNAWITYAEFRQQMNSSIRLLYMSPREAKNRHSIECTSGETLTSAGSLEIFGDVWKYSKLRCLETREMMEPFMRSKAQAWMTVFRMEVLPPRECNQTQWPFHMAFNQSLVKAARSFLETLPASFLAEPEDLAVMEKELALPVSQHLTLSPPATQARSQKRSCSIDLAPLACKTALLNIDNRRTASVRSLSKCDVAIISRFSFHSILEKYPWEKRKFQREMKHKLMELGKLIDVKDDINLEQQATQCDALKTVPFFSDPSDAMHEFVAELAMNTSTYWYKPGTVLMKEGDINCEEMYILLRGSCEVYSCGQLLGRIENDVIGEIGVLDLLERRTATVQTATACQCMKLSRQVMVPILAKYPDARLRLLELARTRLTSINESIMTSQEDLSGTAIQDLCGRLPGCAIGFGPYGLVCGFFLESSFYITASLGTQRRQSRRLRALARRLWWLNRTQQIQSSPTTLRWILRILGGHHSQDRQFLKTIRLRISAMAQNQKQKNAGWLCLWCRVMNGKHANCCRRCGGRWYEVGEGTEADQTTYTQWHRSPSRTRAQNTPQYEDQWPALPPHGRGRGRGKPSSPRPRQSRSRRGKKQQQDTPAPAQQPVNAPGPPGPPPSTGSDTSWMTLLSMQQAANQAVAATAAPSDQPPAAPVAMPADMKKLLTSLKKDQDKLSPENQELVKSLSVKETVKEQKEEEKELQQAVKSLSRARRDLQEAFEARSALHAKWRQFLAMSVAQWQAFTQDFQQQETNAQKKIQDAKDAVTLAKVTFETSKEHVVFKEENKVKETEQVDLMSDDDAAEATATVKLQEGLQSLTTSLQDLHRTAEAAHAEEQASKKARLGDATDVSGMPGLGCLKASQDPFVTKWTHRILKEPDFRAEWHARAAAIRLAFECDTPLQGPPFYSSKDPVAFQSKTLHVTFDESVSLFCHCEDSGLCSSYCGPHGTIPMMIQNFERKVDLDVDPLSERAVCISQSTADSPQSRLSDEFHSIPARIAREGAEQPPGAPNGRPHLPLPAWIGSIFELPAFQAMTPEDIDAQGILLRTWYLHHGHVRRWHVPRFVELDHAWIRWQDELHTSWRDMIQPGEPFHIHTVLPDPDRTYVQRRNVIADVMISQGVDLFSGLITIYEDARPPSAIAVSLPAQVSGNHLADALDSDPSSPFHHGAFHFGWVPIRRLPFPTHRVANGHGFVCRLYAHNHDASQSSDAAVLMQRPLPLKRPLPIAHNEGDAPLWYPFPNAGGHPLDGNSPTEDPDDEQSEVTPPEDDSGAPAGNDPEDPEDFDAHHRQSALMYHLVDNPIHTMLFWTDFERLMRDIAWHYNIQRHDLYDCYELTVRPPDIPEGTAPLIVHFVNDFPHGANMALILLDVEIHGNQEDPNFYTAPEVRRHVLAVPTALTHDNLLIFADTFEYCRIERHRCLIEFNRLPWPQQQEVPIVAAHGDYAKIIVPPPHKCRASTRAMLLDSQEMPVEEFWSHYYEPTSSDDAEDPDATGSDVSPSLIASEDIKREYGPPNHTLEQDADEFSQFQHFDDWEPDDAVFFMQQEAASSSDGPAGSLGSVTAQVVNDSCLLAFDPQTSAWPMWYRQLRTAFWRNAVTEDQTEGPVAYFTTWYADCRSESVTEVSRTLRVDHLSHLWVNDLRHLWRDRIHPDATLHLVWVVPTPPPKPLDRTSGHIIADKFPRDPYIPFLLTFHFMNLDVEGFTHAVVTTDARIEPLRVVSLVNMERVCRGRRCTLHRGTVDATWDIPINVGENIKLAIPGPGERSHDDLVSFPRAVASVQTAPPVQPFPGPSMLLADQSRFVQSLRAVCLQQARSGPANIERLLHITTWYLDGVYVARNDGHRTASLGDDFTLWEEELRAIWSDLQDASLDMHFVLVNPTPPGFPLEEVHVLLFQQVDPEHVGILITAYDNAVTQGAPFTLAAVAPLHVDRLAIIEAAGRLLDCDPRHSNVYCSAWREGLEIHDAQPFHAHPGYSFILQIHHAALHTWEDFADADDDAPVVLLQRSLTKIVSLTCVGDFPVPPPDHVEVPICATASDLTFELSHWGHDCDVVPLQFRDRAFCIPTNWHLRSTHRLFIFEHEDPAAAEGFLAHPFACDPSDLALMQFLYRFGYEKAVITARHVVSETCVLVHFGESTGSVATKPLRNRINPPWPAPQPCVPEAAVFECTQDWRPECLLELGVSLADLQSFFCSSQDVLAPTLERLELPDAALPGVACLTSLESYDRFVIYVDGTSQPSQKHKPPLWVDLEGVPDAWAFIVLGEKYQPDGSSALCLVGWQAQQVRYMPDSPSFAGAQHTGSLVAEREGMIFAALWRLVLNTNRPTVFRSDSLLSCDQAQGRIGTASVDTSFTLLRGLFQALESSMPPTHLIPVDLRVWTPVIPFLWLLFGDRFGGPEFCGAGFDVCAPSLPDVDSPALSPPSVDVSWQLSDMKLSLATANVATLGVGPDGFPGKLAFLKHQFASFRLNFLGIQEARTAEGTICSDHILRLCSGSLKGQLGVELWCNLAQPCLWHADGHSRLTLQNFQVVYRDPRRLLVRVVSDFLQCLLFVGHAPQSGISFAERQLWWESTDQLISTHRMTEPLFAMLDANASPGLADGCSVIDVGAAPSSGSAFLRSFLTAHQLCLPSTAQWHRGPRPTWTTPDGLAMHWIDFVIVPQTFLPYCTWSQTLEELDLATSGLDHVAVGLELAWTSWSSAARTPTGVSHTYDRSKISDMPCNFFSLPQSLPSWKTDVDSHVQFLNQNFHAQLREHCQPKRGVPKKPFVTDCIWALRSAKLKHRRQFKHVLRILQRETLARLFHAWKHPHSDLLDLSFNFGCTLRCGPRPLPFILDASGTPCDSPDKALTRWIEFFMHMEGGFRCSEEAQRARWVRHLEQLQVSQTVVPVTEIPQFGGLGICMRRIKPGKATGPDFLPAELFHFHSAVVAKHTYALFLKSALQAHEPLIHKGGWLVPLWKGKGDRSVCASYRSILISAHMAKAFHRSLRVKNASLYACFMQRQQVGGRPSTPVGLGVHQVRAFQRWCCSRNRPSACVFLDLAEAFYRVIRPLAVSGDVSDDMLAHVAQRLNLDANALAELHALLSEASAIEEAGLPDHVCRAVRGLHQDTHFSLHGQSDRCITTIGSRPGDAWADIAFGFLFAKVLKGLQQDLIGLGLLESIPDHSGPLLFASSELLADEDGSLPAVEFLGPCKGSRRFKEQYFGPSSPQTLPVVGESRTFDVHLVGHYVHLGCVLHHAGDLKIEVRRRLAVAHQMFSKHRKLLFQNLAIGLQKRAQIFQSLIGSRLLYGAESWVLFDQRTKDFVHASIIRLYRRLLRVPHDAHLSDDAILDMLTLPSPSELLRIARLRYLGSLFACKQSASWGILNQDTSWLRLLEDDLLWMYDQLHHASDLPLPSQNLAAWTHLIIWHRPYWKRLIKRASTHAILQRSRHFRLLQFHQTVFSFLTDCGQQMPPPASAQADVSGVFGCMSCRLRCRSKGGEGAHMNRAHGHICPVRTLFQGTQCAICLREFFTFGKLKQHLLRSDSCRTKWVGMACLTTPVPGIGSHLDCQQELAHDRCLPPLQAAGPRRQFDRERDFLQYDLALHDDLALHLFDLTADQCPEQFLRQHLCSRPISWTRCRATILALIATLQDETEAIGAFSADELVPILWRLCDHTSWEFLTDTTAKTSSAFSALHEIENACVDFELDVSTFDRVPRQWSRDRVVLHAFAGRRRKGDFQFFLDQFQALQPGGVCLHTASVDILYDIELGDVANHDTQLFWFRAIDSQQVVGFLGGPPCETWSKARKAELGAGISGPRIVRSADFLWGFHCLRLRELLQVIMGNDLLTFAILCLLRLARVHGVGILEHPADPADEDVSSIWRLPVLHLLRQLPGAQIHSLSQGLFGAPTPKPTMLYSLNLPNILSVLREHWVTTELPKRSSIGKLSDGSWATTRLKEYPPSLCRALAWAMHSAIHATPSVEHGPSMDSFLASCRPLLIQEYQSQLGQDYAG